MQTLEQIAALPDAADRARATVEFITRRRAEIDEALTIRDQAIAAYRAESGRSQRRVAREFGLSASTVGLIDAQWGPPRPPGQRRRARDAVVVTLRERAG